MIRLKWIVFGTALVAAALPLSGRGSLAQDWPHKPVKVVVPFAAAGTTDRMGRLIADELTKTFKQQFYVENRVGGGASLPRPRSRARTPTATP